ncbi:MAG: polymer-forming cytoskeletal protein [Bacteroidia bacterium]|nr:polymer-forming cytoskeletal protein [Bacteroidia bacterium]NNF31533.1 polymer-forming cytoskeletal protein [Flavobacteriaceae bacterium]MBT8275608.1 polymer-forming cytoskeletal protein [Bacteroidia bacterium]NNJ82798.1 polymer-forming cytoskeletal protein [Flavobacteriaceae bacterium]NNK54112.1 polymer-forming cytoskeletal protein [Flavobacteriaceae bacterium]
MFSDKKDKKNMEPTASQNRINEGTKLKGDIQSKGFFRIDGVIDGNVNTPSKVVLGKTGVITGTLTCENADIEGTFDGKLDVTGTLTLKATARITGDVVVGKLAVEPGATFNASCVMKGSEKGKATSASDNASAETKKSQNHPFDRTQRIQKPKTEQQT